MKRKFVKYTLLIGAVVAVCATTLFATRNDFGLGRNMEIMVNLMHAISTKYVDEVDADEMMRNGAEGICSKLDPYTDFIPEEDMPDFETMTTGRYGGIGSLIRKKGDYVIIAEPYKGSPADEAGLKVGDKIVAINGESMKGAKVEDISKRLRGEPNTTVEVTIEKLIDSTRHDYKIKRRRIAIPSITYAGYVAEGVGYIRHADFTDKCYDDMRAAIERLQKSGELKSLILDYRNNGGGLLDAAVKVLSLFVPKGTMVVETRSRGGASRKLHTPYEPLLPDTPLAVLINGNSASAAEIVAGAIQDLDRGVLIGQRSYGKGLVQGTAPLGYNAYAKITVGKYYIPSGRCIQALNYSKDGRAEQVADSLISEFKTVAGRKVYDGGGIMPDKPMKPKYISTFAATLYLMGIIEDFGDDYIKRNGEKQIDVRSFSITDEDYADFMRMVEKRDIPYKSESRLALEKLRKALAKERNDSLEESLSAIDKGLKDDKISNLETFRKEIIESINTNIVLRYAYAEGVIANSLKDDEEIIEAVKLLDNSKEYHRILAEQDTERNNTTK
ncbi:MAG: PDZ domain-containing protein [Alistipes sp.]|nr:PDZ domain-containing protein [Alistipes sp.]